MEHAANITGFDRWLEKITYAADGPMSTRHMLESVAYVCTYASCEFTPPPPERRRQRLAHAGLRGDG